MVLADSHAKCTVVFTMFQGNRDPLSQRLPNTTTRLELEKTGQLLFPGTWLMLLS